MRALCTAMNLVSSPKDIKIYYKITFTFIFSKIFGTFVIFLKFHRESVVWRLRRGGQRTCVKSAAKWNDFYRRKYSGSQTQRGNPCCQMSQVPDSNETGPSFNNLHGWLHLKYHVNTLFHFCMNQMNFTSNFYHLPFIYHFLKCMKIK